MTPDERKIYLRYYCREYYKKDSGRENMKACQRRYEASHRDQINARQRQRYAYVRETKRLLSINV